MAVKDLRENEMMANLLDTLDQQKSIGHYGRLVFAMVGRHFLSEAELVKYLAKDPDCDEGKAKSLVAQVQTRDYNPPKRQRILEWQQQQDFQICPLSDDPDACNVYKNLTFPDGVYERIEEYYEQKATS